VIVWAPEVPLRPHPLADMDSSLKFASPVINRYIPIDVTAGWAVFPVDTRSPFYS